MTSPRPARNGQRHRGAGQGIGRYLFELLLAFAGYGVVLAASLTWLGRGIDHPALRLIVTLAPMLPAIAIVWVIVREIRRRDELYLKLQFEALVIAFVGTALLTFSYGFLENIGYPQLSMFAVWPLMSTLWALALFACHWRYRGRDDEPPPSLRQPPPELRDSLPELRHPSPEFRREVAG